MNQNQNLITRETFETVTGPIDYNLTNDYLFKATMQECEEAQKGIVSALLRVPPEELAIVVNNPIILGKSIAGKDFYLDVNVTINRERIMNIEMQVKNFGNYPERSTRYVARQYDNVAKGANYKDVMPVHHVSFVNFDMFEEDNEFYDTFTLKNKNNKLVYTDKFIISVVNLKRINKASALDKEYKLDQWARLITAKTWEELKEISKGDSYMEATARKLFDMESDFAIREEAIRRQEYYAYVDSIKADNEAKDAEIARLKAELDKLKNK